MVELMYWTDAVTSFICVLVYVGFTLVLFSNGSSSLASSISLWSCDEVCQTYHTRLDRYCHRSLLADKKNLEGLFSSDGEARLPKDIAKNFKLQQVHVVARHGDRSPIHQQLGTYPVYYECGLNSSQVWRGLEDFKQPRPLRFDSTVVHSHQRPLYPGSAAKPCKNGMLTVEGFRQHKALGALLSARYSSHLFENSVSIQQVAESIYVQSTDTRRTLHSAAAFMLGFLPDQRKWRQQVTLHVSPGVLLHAPAPWVKPVFKTCKNFHSFAASQLWKTNYHQTELSQYMPFFERLVYVFKQTSLKRLAPREVFDSIVTRGCHVKDNPLPCSSENCLDYNSANKLFEYIDWTFVNYNTPLAATLASIPFLRHSLYETMLDVVNHKPGAKKFLLSVGHDTTITQYLTALGISVDEWMPYATRVTFELWKSSQGSEKVSYVRVLLNGVPVTNQLVPWKRQESEMLHSELLPFTEWEDFLLVGKYRDVESYDTECTRTHSLR